MTTVWDEDFLARTRVARAAPNDFDSFWHDTLAAQPTDLEIDIRPVTDEIDLIDTFDVSYSGAGGAPIRAWLHLPATRGDAPLPTVVQYLGYNGGRGLSHQWNTWATAGYAHLVMDTRGQGTGDCPGDTPDPDGSAPSVGGFLTRGILDRSTYYYRRVFVDAVRLVQVAERLNAVDSTRIAVAGTSQGGGIATAVAGLSKIPSALLADVPFLADFSRAVQLADTDPYGEIRRYLASHRDDVDAVFETLDYFDVAHHASRARIPAIFSVAEMDSICPPPTIHAIVNGYGSLSASIVPPVVVRYRFNDHEGGGAHFVREQLRWLAELWQPAAEPSSNSQHQKGMVR